MKPKHYKPLVLVSAILAATLIPVTAAESANYSTPTTGLPGKIQLGNVSIMSIDGTIAGGIGGSLTAQDNQPLYNGQIFQVEGVSPAVGVADASFSDFDGKLIIPKMPQSVLLLKTNTSPLQFTVTALSSSASTSGAIGLTGTQGVAGAQGLIGLTGAAGVAGTQGPIGLTGASGANGAQGLIGLTGAKGEAGAIGARGLTGANGINGTGVTIHTIGEQYAGGKVFYVYDGGQHGLIAALADQHGGIAWSNGKERDTFAKGNGIGAGAMNTAIIIAAQAGDGVNNFAARVAAEYSVLEDGVTPCTADLDLPSPPPTETCIADWYLPSRVELNLLYLQQAVIGKLNTFCRNCGGAYWSSTELVAMAAWNKGFDEYSAESKLKNIKQRVRAIRAF